MTRRNLAPAAAAALLLLLGASAALAQRAPLAGGAAGTDGLRLGIASGAEVTFSVVDRADGDEAAAALAFTKESDEPRLVALAADCKGIPGDTRTLALRQRVKLTGKGSAQWTVAFFEEEGSCWYKSGAAAVAGDAFADLLMPIDTLRQAAFSQDGSGALERAAVNRVWIGLLLTGPCDGSFEISRAELSTEPYRAAAPLPITEGAGTWSVGSDPAVTVHLTTPNEGPNGEPCMRVDFTMPGGKHMYMVPATPAPAAALEGYSGISITYRADLPPGINGLLFMLGEQGAQWFASPAPPATNGEWKTLIVPFEQFELGNWSRDDNGKLDVSYVNQVMCGMHGSTTDEQGVGTIWVMDLKLVP
jgi:hypothetical protein